MQMKTVSETINDIILMPNNREKDIAVVNLANYLNYLKMIEKISDDSFDEYKDLITTMFSNTFNKIKEERVILQNDFYNQKENLLNIYQKVLLFAKDYKLDILDIDNIDITNYIKYVKDFFKWFDDDLYKLYENLEDKGLIHAIVSDRYYGLAHLIGKDEYAIMVSLQEGISTLVTIVHEMGHIYYYHILRDNPELITRYLSSECISTSLERLFIIYLKERNIINKELINKHEINKHIMDLMKTDCAYVVNKNIIINKNNNVKTSLENYKRLGILSHKSFQDPNHHLQYRQNKYSYAFLFASVIEERFIKDEKWTKYFLKEYPKLVRELDSENLISLFYDDDYVNAVNNKTNKLLIKNRSLI